MGPIGITCIGRSRFYLVGNGSWGPSFVAEHTRNQWYGMVSCQWAIGRSFPGGNIDAVPRHDKESIGKKRLEEGCVDACALPSDFSLGVAEAGARTTTLLFLRSCCKPVLWVYSVQPRCPLRWIACLLRLQSMEGFLWFPMPYFTSCAAKVLLAYFCPPDQAAWSGSCFKSVFCCGLTLSAVRP